MPTSGELKVGRRKLAVANLDKVLFRAGSFTKADLMAYYEAIAPALLPHLKGRPITLKRFPDGIYGEAFYEKDAPGFTPKWVKRAPVPRRSGESDIQYIVINDRATLLWVASIATIELHPFLHRAPQLDRPTAVAFDLDPGEGADLLDCIRVAHALKERLDALGLRSFPKVSGSKGLQLYVPLNSPVTYAATQAFARALAEMLAREDRSHVTADMAKAVRRGRVFIDWSQNADFKTTVAVYSVRAKRDRPYVSMPVAWEELDRALRRKSPATLDFTPDAAVKRVTDLGDLFAPVLKLKQKLPREFLEALPEPVREMPVARSLHAYAEKRDFARTAEPPPMPAHSAQGSRRRFVVQKHAASHPHYDFRLEIGDALKSWAVPKGVPTRVGDRRSAFETEDHPLEYLQFEGVIPQGEYGGGTVMVWDIGTFEIVEGNYYQGRLTVYLRGKKLRGEWLLERTREEEGRRIWLMSRQGKSMKAITAKQEDASALSGRTMAAIAGARDAVWTRDRGEERKQEPTGPKEKPRFVEPMKCKLVERLPAGEEWLWEIKWDGYRCIAVRTGSRVELYSRYAKQEFTKRFASLTRALEEVPGTWTIDGEIVALDDEGRPTFQRLQNNRSSEVPTVFYAFDLLNENGRSLLGSPMSKRRSRLEALLAGLEDPIRVSANLTAAAEEAAEAIKELGLEGIVGKRADSRYEPGERSGAWIKQRFSRDADFLIGGWIPGANGFDSLLVGQAEGKKLRFVAKVKNGFVPATRDLVFERIAPLEIDTCPFSNLPEKKGARRSNPLTKEGMKQCRWCQPEVSCRVGFVEWTDAGNLRHATFIGLREEGHR